MVGPAARGAEDEPRFLIVGTVRRPHGIRGDLSVAVQTDSPEQVFVPGRTLRLGDAEGRPGADSVTIDAARPFKDGMLLKTVEHTQRDAAAEALRGRTLLIPETEAAPLAEDEVFIHQLVGMAVQVEEQGEIGRVCDVLEGNAAPLLVVRRPEGKELLVPFVREFVTQVDVEARRLHIHPPPGLLEL